MVIPSDGLGCPNHAAGFMNTLLLVAVCHALGQNGLWKRLMLRVPAPITGFAYATAFAFAILLAPDNSKAFIYFQF
jgi:alginate O-acetyltransferase complex protein AlgI